jgi:alpha-tubulin suppressor-like RCC1 family protein
MLTYDFSQRISTGSDSSAVLGSDNIPVFSCKNSAAITRYRSIGSGVAIAQGMVAILHEDGTVSRTDTTSSELSMFKDIVAISSNDYLLVGLKKDGTAVTYQQYDTEDYEDEVESWTDLVSVSVALAHTAGLRENGTVVAAGDHSYNACDVEDWTDIVRISTGTFFTAGLRADGTVISTDPSEYDTSSWTNIIAIDASEHYLVGIDMSGKVHLAGYDAYTKKFAYVSSWKSLLATAKGSNFIIALGSDGMLHAYGDDEDMQYDLIVAEKYFPEISY